MATAHIKAEKGDFAETVLMPGDPLRAKWIAETFLEDAKQVNNVRGMLGFTGTYKGKKVSVMGSGMGIATIGIYSFELFNEFDVKNIIRIGSCGAYDPSIELREVFIADKAWSESTFAVGNGVDAPNNTLEASDKLVKLAEEVSATKDCKVQKGTIHSSDVFYNVNKADYFLKTGMKVVEMEAYGLYTVAKRLKKNALTICTVSDNIATQKSTTSEERQNTFSDMVEIGLEIALKA